MRDDRVEVLRIALALGLSAVFGAADQYLGTLSHDPWGATRSLSAPWLVLPFVVGAMQREQRRAAVMGLACTLFALCGYGLMMLSPVGTHHLTLGEAQGYLGNEGRVFLASLVTGPLFGWFGWRWRSSRAIAGALITAAALCLEPYVRAFTARPVRFLDVALAEMAAGLGLATAVLVRQGFLTVLPGHGPGRTRTDEQPEESYLGRLGLGFGIAGICIALVVIAVCVLWFWVATHFAAGIG